MSRQIELSKTSSSISSASPILNGDLQCALTVVLCIALAAFSLNLSQVPTFPLISSIALLNVILLVLTYILLAKSSPNIPNLGLTFVISFCSVMVFNLSHNMAFVGISLCLLISPLSLWLTQSYIHCFISLFTQLINIILLFRLHLEDAMKYMPLERLAEKISLSITLAALGVILMFGYVFHSKVKPISDSIALLGSCNKNYQLNLPFDQDKLLNSFTFEVKNLIETLFGSLSLMITHIEPGLGEKLVKIALVSTENLQRVIDNIVHISSDKFESKKSEYAPSSIVNLFCKVWDSMLLLIHKKGLEGNITFDSNLPEVLEIDSTKTSQIILNLIDYFIHGTERGCLDLTVEKVEMIPHFDLVESLTSNNLSPENVTDTSDEEFTRFGCSKTAAILRKLKPRNKVEKMLKVTIRNGTIKESSEKVESSFQKVQEGFMLHTCKNNMAGLSLYMSKMICEKMGGKIDMYKKEKGDKACIAYIPFETFLEEKLKMKRTSLDLFRSLPLN